MCWGGGGRRKREGARTGDFRFSDPFHPRPPPLLRALVGGYGNTSRARVHPNGQHWRWGETTVPGMRTCLTLRCAGRGNCVILMQTSAVKSPLVPPSTPPAHQFIKAHNRLFTHFMCASITCTDLFLEPVEWTLAFDKGCEANLEGINRIGSVRDVTFEVPSLNK